MLGAVTTTNFQHLRNGKKPCFHKYKKNCSYLLLICTNPCLLLVSETVEILKKCFYSALLEICSNDNVHCTNEKYIQHCEFCTGQCNQSCLCRQECPNSKQQLCTWTIPDFENEINFFRRDHDYSMWLSVKNDKADFISHQAHYVRTMFIGRSSSLHVVVLFQFVCILSGWGDPEICQIF